MAGAERDGRPADLTGVAVLVVDDDPGVLDAMRELLEICGATVTPAGSAHDAIAYLVADRPDVLITDLRMPGLDGYWLVRRLRALYPDVPALAVTGYGHRWNRADAIQAGFVEQIEKPLDFEAFCMAVARLARPVASTSSGGNCPRCQSRRMRLIRPRTDGWLMECLDCTTTFHVNE